MIAPAATTTTTIASPARIDTAAALPPLPDTDLTEAIAAAILATYAEWVKGIRTGRPRATADTTEQAPAVDLIDGLTADAPRSR